MVDWARARREAMRKLADVRRRLATAEQALAHAQAAVKRAEAAFDTADDRFAEAERALDAARAERARSREERYQARQAHDRASTTVERLQRRVRDLADRLERMPPLTAMTGLAGRLERMPALAALTGLAGRLGWPRPPRSTPAAACPRDHAASGPWMRVWCSKRASRRMGQSGRRWPRPAPGHRVDGPALIHRFAVCGRWRQRPQKNVGVGVIAHKRCGPAAVSAVTTAPAVT